MQKRMFENICMMKKIRVGVSAMGVRTKCRGCRAESSRSCMAMPYKKDNTLCSPTSALKNNPKDTNAEPPGRGTEEIFLMDSDEFIVGIRKPFSKLILYGEQRFSPVASQVPVGMLLMTGRYDSDGDASR
jgi:hypothetical protein